jgi:exopolysaccharide biosynthesis polyprenyl glycosylphosphotransferase
MNTLSKSKKRRDAIISFFRKHIVLLGDLMLLTLSLMVYLILFDPAINSFSDTSKANPFWFLVLAVVWLVYSYFFRLYSLINAAKTNLMIQRTFMVAFFTALTYLFVPFLSPHFPSHRLPLYFFLLQTTIVITLWHFIFATLFQEPILEKRALIVGAGWSGREIVKVLLQNEKIYREKAYKILGFLDDDPKKHRMVYEGVKVLAATDMLVKYAVRLKIDETIVAVPYDKAIKGKLYNNLLLCEQAGIVVRPVNEVYEEATGMVMVKQKNNEYFLSYPYLTQKSKDIYIITSRVANIIIGFCGVFFMLLLVPFIAAMNIFFNRGSLFYSQVRVGLHNRPFTIYKFRTMIPDAEKNTGAVWAHQNDARITFFGKWLRKTRLDELPQFWNILSGEMNLIGPRPERPEFVEKLLKTIPFYNTRHIVKPGITGWAQVNYKYGSNESDSLRKLQYDLFYIKYRSILLDMIILLRTLGVVVKFKGM